MKYLKQAALILAFSLAGQVLQKYIPLPIPAAIYGFILLFIALCAGLLKEEHIDETAGFLIKIMPVLFVAPGVNLLSYWKLISKQWAAIITIILVSTFLVFAVSGLVTKALRRKEIVRE